MMHCSDKKLLAFVYSQMCTFLLTLIENLLVKGSRTWNKSCGLSFPNDWYFQALSVESDFTKAIHNIAMQPILWLLMPHDCCHSMPGICLYSHQSKCYCIIRPHCSTTYVDVACYRPSSVVCRSVCWSVCQTSLPCKKWLNRLRCHLGWGLGWAHGAMY